MSIVFVRRLVNLRVGHSLGMLCSTVCRVRIRIRSGFIHNSRLASADRPLVSRRTHNRHIAKRINTLWVK